MAKKERPDAEISQDVDETSSVLDDMKVESLKNHMELQLLKHKAMELESERLTAKYGENHARVLKMRQRMGFNESLFPALRMQVDLTMRAKDESFDLDTWQVQGFVFDDNLNPLEGLQVALFLAKTENEKEEKQNWQAVTDVSGFYRINLGKEAIQQLNGRELLIQLVEARQIIYRSETLLTPFVGQIDLENITIERVGRKKGNEIKK
ncbi:hypothetical protein [Hymenobacter volaticus]|uniref:Carboxypeptidase regulatory-like domain-containing protein n=1 Tax=Hymenobacter volaticus TaxID=2932254 RepID=A0ABY4G2B9_9BACT|nr:hypothetical protein [Hymenobacter volaticus]UOQ64804.1 hypothetical protein MUN86_14660 [Hymenobacter volaticus]